MSPVMAARDLMVLALLLFLFSLRASIAQSEAANQSEAAKYATFYENEAADDQLCLGPKAIETSRLLAQRFQDNAVMTEKDFRRLLTDFDNGVRNHGGAMIADCADDTTGHLKINGGKRNCSESLAECSSLETIYFRHATEEGLNYSQLAVALQEVAFFVTNPKCSLTQELHHGRKPSTGQAWGYGIGFVTLICIISNVGALLTPFMAKTFFQRLLQFLVAMAAGTLTATGLLVLIPEAFDIVSVVEINDYIWKAATVLFSIYVFFISERFLKFFLKSRESKGLKKNQSLHISPASENEKDSMTPFENDQSDHSHAHFVNHAPGKRRGPVATVAWIVLIGDVIHKFMDGMAIGAAFTENIYPGVSIGIAELCEELLHELGDVAILLHSGMSMKRALILNFLSGCVCYVGLVLGIVLGENTEANRWILAVAGGLFLYIPLVDMLPEMNQHLEMKMREGRQSEVRVLFLLHALGLLLGFLIICLVANFVGEVDIM